jgi:4-hydroxybutyrate CoA-transferase
MIELQVAGWREKYASKIVSAQTALASVKPGDRVVVAHACGEPQTLVQALVDRAPELANVEVVHMVAEGPAKYAQPGMEKSFRVNTFFVGASTREAVADGRGDYTPVYFSETPRLFKQKILSVDVMLVQVTPPDEDGFCSYGLSVDYTQSATESAHIVIAQMNASLPRTFGAKVSLDTFTYIVEKDEPPIELKPAKLDDIDKKIGEHVASLVPDGATLQLGIGAIPDAVLTFLGGKKDLGIHSEMFSDSVVDLARAGVITNKRKTIHPGKFTATFLMGSRKLYDFVNNNPDVEMLAVDYVNDPFVIGQFADLISINSALSVDLMGQVNAETIDGVQYSGIGGQVDFERGASRSPGGKAIIAMPSTAAHGKVSRICRSLGEGEVCSTGRCDVHFVVTEYGIADLRGKTLRQRSEALIAISHPDFRAMLAAPRAKKR